MHLDQEDLEVEEILWLLDERRKKVAGRNYYKPLDPERRDIIRAHYRSKLTLPEVGDGRELRTQSGTRVCKGYTRIVVGDYGAFVEFSQEQAFMGNFWRRGGEGRKYNWLTVRDQAEVKVYEQVGTVSYADYRVGMYYVSPNDVS